MSRAPGTRRVSRGFLFAVGTVATSAGAAVVSIACDGRLAPEPVATPLASTDTGGEAPSVDFADAGQDADAYVEPPYQSVPFACGDAGLQCNSGVEYCHRHITDDMRVSCYHPDDPPGHNITEQDDCRKTWPPPACVEHPTCRCFAEAGVQGECTQGVGWEVVEMDSLSGCGGCYGSPPARPLRMS